MTPPKPKPPTPPDVSEALAALAVMTDSLVGGFVALSALYLDLSGEMRMTARTKVQTLEYLRGLVQTVVTADGRDMKNGPSPSARN